MKKNVLKIYERIKNSFMFKIVICCFILLIFIALFYLDLRDKVYTNKFDFNDYKISYIIFSFAIAAIVILSIIFLKKAKECNLWKLYLILGILFGSIYIFAMPVFTQSDEPSHFYRAYEIANGSIMSKKIKGVSGNYFPKSIQKIIYTGNDKVREHKKYSDEIKMKKYKLKKNQKESVTNYASGYTAINYIPQIIGIKIACVLNLKPIYVVIAGRISGLILTVLLFAFGIKILPIKKLFMTIVLLSPVVLSYAASISADPFTLASSFVIISYIIRYIYSKDKIQLKDKIIISIFSIFTALCKITYLPLTFLLIFLPDKSFKNKKRKYLYVLSTIIFGIILNLSWSYIANVVATNEVAYVNTYKWIFSNPIEYLVIIIRTTLNNSYDYLTSAFAGKYLVHSQISIYPIISLSYVIIFFFALFNEKSNIKVSIFNKIMAFLVGAGIYCLIVTAMYVFNTACATYDGYPVANGVQGRYLLPLIPLLIFFVNNKKFNFKNYQLISVILIINFTIFLTMFITFMV